MKRYLIIGKSPQMCDVFLKDAQGKFRQHKFNRGKKMEVTEHEMTFHVIRQQGYKLIQVVELDPVEEEPKPLPIELDEPVKEAEEVFIVEETPAVHIEESDTKEAVAPTRKRRKRKKSQV